MFAAKAIHDGTPTPSPSAGSLYDAIIVGAGPAGSVAAALLASRGMRVLLVDRAPFPRKKACGGCVNAAAIAMLHDMGFANALEGTGQLTQLIINVAGRCLTLPMPTGAAVARNLFDARLVEEAARRGAIFADNTSAKLLPAQPDSPFRTLRLTSKNTDATINAKIVLACDGLRGTLLNAEPGAAWHTHPNSRIGISLTLHHDSIAFPNPATLAMCVSRHGYVGLVQRPDGLLHVGASIDPDASNRARGALHLIRHILHDCRIELPALSTAPFEGTAPLTGRRNAIAAYRALAIGDACGYVEPFTGEGISWAIRGARAAVSLLPNDLTHWPMEFPAAWRALHQKEIIRRQASCRWLRQIVRHPHVASACLNAARCAPWIPAMMTRHITA